MLMSAKNTLCQISPFNDKMDLFFVLVRAVCALSHNLKIDSICKSSNLLLLLKDSLSRPAEINYVDL